ncbi:hypothetical protein HFP72_02645 [Nocardiopsis sp. ARC36]
MSTDPDRRWTERARELEFTRLPELRQQAEGWRNALTALTALPAVLMLLKGQDKLAELPGWARYGSMALLLLAFLLLSAAMLLAARAAYGAPGQKILVGGQSLRRWTEDEVARVARKVRWAFVLCLTGMSTVMVAVTLSWVGTTEAPTDLVSVKADDNELCGRLVLLNTEQVVVGTGRDHDVREAVPLPKVITLEPVTTCATPGEP